MVMMVVVPVALNNHCAVVVMMAMMILHRLKLRLIANSAVPLVSQDGDSIGDRFQ
jgi:hypothetical protein